MPDDEAMKRHICVLQERENKPEETHEDLRHTNMDAVADSSHMRLLFSANGVGFV